MAVSGTTWISYYDEESQTWISGQIYADDNGHLYKGWNQYPGPGKAEYYGDDYIATVKNFYRTAMYCIILMKRLSCEK